MGVNFPQTIQPDSSNTSGEVLAQKSVIGMTCTNHSYFPIENNIKNEHYQSNRGLVHPICSNGPLHQVNSNSNRRGIRKGSMLRAQTKLRAPPVATGRCSGSSQMDDGQASTQRG
jgi:hypothetical protein